MSLENKIKWWKSTIQLYDEAPVWHVGRCCVGLLTFLSDHRPANSNITLAWGAGPLCSHQLHICCFNNNNHRKKFLIIDQFDVKWHCLVSLQQCIWDWSGNRNRILNLVILVTSSLALCRWSGLVSVMQPTTKGEPAGASAMTSDSQIEIPEI